MRECALMPRIALVLCFAALLCAAPASATPGSAPVPFPVVGEPADALIDGDTAYIAGDVREVGRPSGPLSFLDASGAVRRDFPDITSDGAGAGLDFEDEIPDLSIRALEPDGEGGFYVGGEFDRVLGQRRVNFVHLRADGTIDPVFRAQASGLVMEIEKRGDVLYVGGTFSVIGGKVKRGLAKLDARTGEVLDWGPAGGIGQVESLSISGDRMFVAGSFTSPRRGAAALDLATGRVLDWDAHLEDSVQLRAIAARDGRVFFGGHFSWVQNKELSGAASVSADDSATLSPWRPGGDEVTQIELGPQAVVMIGRLGRRRDDPARLRPGHRRAAPVVRRHRRQRVRDHRGRRHALRGARAARSSAYDLRTGARLPYLSTAGSGTVLAAGGGALATNGGGLRDATARVGAAALDLRTGAVLPFDAKLDGTVVEPVPGSLPGALRDVGELAREGRRHRLHRRRVRDRRRASADLPGGGRRGHRRVAPRVPVRSRRTGHRPGDQRVDAVRRRALHPARRPHGHQARCDRPRRPGRCSTGRPRSRATAAINALEVVGSKLFVGACELRVYDVATRAALPTTGQPEGTVYALEPDGVGGVWVGGRAYWDQDADLRHIDANGLNVPYDVTDGAVHEIEAAGSELFLAGAFSELAGEPRWSLGSIDLSTGRTTRFRPEPATDWGMGNTLSMLETLPDGGLLIGGNFRFMSLGAVSGLARFAPSGETSPPTPRGEAPIIVGEAATGSVQRVYGGDFAGSPVTIDAHWQRCSGSTCTDIDHVGWSYTLEDEDAGHRMRVALIAQNDAGASEPLLSEPGPDRPRPEAVRDLPRLPVHVRRAARRRDAHDGRRPVGTGADVAALHVAALRLRGRLPADPRRDRPHLHDDERRRRPAPPGHRLREQRRRRARVHRPGGDRPDPDRRAHRAELGQDPDARVHRQRRRVHARRPAHRLRELNGRIGWLRCDASGANCTRLASEMQAYEATPADLGHTLRQTLITFGPGGESPESTSAAEPRDRPGPRPDADPNPQPGPVPDARPDPARQLVADRGADPRPDEHGDATATRPRPARAPTATASPGPSATSPDSDRLAVPGPDGPARRCTAHPPRPARLPRPPRPRPPSPRAPPRPRRASPRPSCVTAACACAPTPRAP